MTRLSVCLALCLAIGGSVASPCLGALPVIQQVRIDRGTDVTSWGITFYHQLVSVTVPATEPQTVSCVTINDPSGNEWVISV